jgi:hypothetical protein
MGNWRDNPVACAYDLRDWGRSPVCYSMRPSESKKSPGYYVRGSMPGVRKVPSSFSGYRRRKKR